MHLTFCASQGEDSVPCADTENETCVSDVMLETKKASMMWRHPSCPQGKKFKAFPPQRRIMAPVFEECSYGAFWQLSLWSINVCLM